VILIPNTIIAAIQIAMASFGFCFLLNFYFFYTLYHQQLKNQKYDCIK